VETMGKVTVKTRSKRMVKTQVKREGVDINTQGKN